MGTITCPFHTLVPLLLRCTYSQVCTSRTYLTAGPGAVLSKTYINSVLAVLNARKTLRDRERANLSVLELPRIPTTR
ncbi:hypothetical protein V8B97DRAFT_1961885 [Scleroderma yunnanense]